MSNKILKDYIESTHNKQNNYFEILSKTKEVSEMKPLKCYLTKLLVTVSIVLIAFISIPKVYAYIKWNVQFSEFMEIPRQEAVGIKIDEELVDMDHIEKNGIKAKIESLVASSDEIRIKMSFEFDKDIEVNSRTFTYSYVIYDENNNIYTIYNSNLNNKIDKLPELVYRELNIEYNKNDLYANQYADATSIENLSAKNRKIINEIRLSSLKGFPKSKKIYVRILGLGYNIIDKKEIKVEKSEISDEIWIFEIDIPDRFYYSNIYDLKLKNEIDEFIPLKIKLSDTGLIILAKDKYISEALQNGYDLNAEEFTKMQNDLIYITNAKGDRIQLLDITSSSDEINVKFSASKQMIENDKLILNIKREGIIYQSELLKK